VLVPSQLHVGLVKFFLNRPELAPTLPDALSVQSESANRHVPVFLRLNHVADNSVSQAQQRDLDFP